MSTDDVRGMFCAVCRENRVTIPHGTCDECKQELRVENRHEYFEALSWEYECAEERRRR